MFSGDLFYGTTAGGPFFLPGIFDESHSGVAYVNLFAGFPA